MAVLRLAAQSRCMLKSCRLMHPHLDLVAAALPKALLCCLLNSEAAQAYSAGKHGQPARQSSCMQVQSIQKSSDLPPGS